MDPKPVFESQYASALRMLSAAVRDGADASVWLDPAPKNPFWHIAYHAAFYADLYLSVDDGAFTPWRDHVPNSQFFGTLPWPPFDPIPIDQPYRVEQVTEYIESLVASLGRRLALLDWQGESGFEWIPLNKFELQIYNIRHVQHHAGQLIDRVRRATGSGVDWIGQSEVTS